MTKGNSLIMKVIFEKEEILAAVSPMLGVVSSKNTIAAIEGIKITTHDGYCELAAFDNEKGIKNKVKATVEDDGSYILNAVRFAQILKVMPEGDITVEINEKNVTKICNGISSFELHALPGEDFPILPELGGNNGFSIIQTELRDLISNVMFSVAVNNPKPMLNGVYFKIEGKKITLVSCDGNRLALREKVCDINNSVGDDKLDIEFILPGKSLVELMKLLDDDKESVNITLGRKHVIFEIGGMIFFTHMIEGAYIEYERFIPKTSRLLVTVESNSLIRSLERALLVTEEKNMGQTRSPLRCSFRDEFMTLTSSSMNGSFYDEIQVEKDGIDLDIGFNCRFFMDAMRAVYVDRVKLSMSTPLMCMTIEPEEKNDDDRFIYLILPVKMKD